MNSFISSLLFQGGGLTSVSTVGGRTSGSPPLEGRRPGRGATDIIYHIFRGLSLPSPNQYMSFGGWQLPNDSFNKSEATASYRTHSRCPRGRIPGASRAFGDRLAGIVCQGPKSSRGALSATSRGPPLCPSGHACGYASLLT